VWTVVNDRLDLREIGWESMNWIHLAQDRDQWRTGVSTVMNLWGSIKCGEFIDWMSDLVSQDGLCFMELVI
jgi:hypothetical protein